MWKPSQGEEGKGMVHSLPPQPRFAWSSLTGHAWGRDASAGENRGWLKAEVAKPRSVGLGQTPLETTSELSRDTMGETSRLHFPFSALVSPRCGQRNASKGNGPAQQDPGECQPKIPERHPQKVLESGATCMPLRCPRRGSSWGLG